MTFMTVFFPSSFYFFLSLLTKVDITPISFQFLPSFPLTTFFDLCVVRQYHQVTCLSSSPLCLFGQYFISVVRDRG